MAAAAAVAVAYPRRVARNTIRIYLIHGVPLIVTLREDETYVSYSMYIPDSLRSERPNDRTTGSCHTQYLRYLRYHNTALVQYYVSCWTVR
jgi:hypothetical protein